MAYNWMRPVGQSGIRAEVQLLWNVSLNGIIRCSLGMLSPYCIEFVSDIISSIHIAIPMAGDLVNTFPKKRVIN